MKNDPVLPCLAFYKASAFNRDISGWDVASVTTMFSSKLGWGVESVGLGRMKNYPVLPCPAFYQASNFTGDISEWDVANVANMDESKPLEDLFDHACIDDRACAIIGIHCLQLYPHYLHPHSV